MADEADEADEAAAMSRARDRVVNPADCADRSGGGISTEDDDELELDEEDDAAADPTAVAAGSTGRRADATDAEGRVRCRVRWLSTKALASFMAAWRASEIDGLFCLLTVSGK